MLPEPKRTEELKHLLKREDSDDRMSLNSKIELISLMGDTEKVRNIKRILDYYMGFESGSLFLLEPDDAKMLLSLLPKSSHEKILQNFLKAYLKGGHYWASVQYAELLGRNLHASELDTLLNVCLSAKNFRVVRAILGAYPEASRKNKIKYVFQRSVEMKCASDGTDIVNHFK